MRFTVGIFGREQFQHSACFEEVAQALASALRDLGHETVGFGPGQGRLIMFGVNNVVDEAKQMPPDAIVFNTEQLASTEGMRHMESWKQLRNHVIWDYSRENIAVLRNHGFEHAVYCPIGHHERMENRIARDVEQDIDVLHYGALNVRRRKILEQIEALGLKVEHLFGVYGAERDAVIARAKVVVNLHFYDHPVFEIFRVSHLLANLKTVVTEGGGCDMDLEDFASRTCLYTAVENVPAACQFLCRDAEVRTRWAYHGYEQFRRVRFIDHVERAIKESP